MTATRALDRVLRAGHYWVPHWYKAAHHVAYWDKFGRPAVKPRYERGITRHLVVRCRKSGQAQAQLTIRGRQAAPRWQPIFSSACCSSSRPCSGSC